MWGGSTLIASQIDEAHMSLCVDQGAAGVVAIRRVMTHGGNLRAGAIPAPSPTPRRLWVLL